MLLPALLAVAPSLSIAANERLHVLLQGASADDMATLVREQNGELTHKLDIINAVGARLSRQQLDAILDTGKVDRHIDDLALKDQPVEPAPAEAGCRVAGAVEIDRAGRGFSWRLYNKSSAPQQLRELELSWPAALGGVRAITLGGQPLLSGSPGTGEQPLKLAFTTDKAPGLVGQQKLAVAFEHSPHEPPAQSEYQLTLSFGENCDVSLIPGYSDNADNYYYSEVSGADALHRHGVRGKGVTVAVLDSGLWDHPNLVNDSQGNDRVVARYDAISHSEGSVFDESGHGSHLTSILAHSGATLHQGSPTGGYKGVAPDVSIVAIKAFDESGQGGLLNIVRGVQWAVDNREKYGIKVLNLSFSARPRWPYFLDPINQAVMRAWLAGITVIAAAGNSGPEPMTVGSPGNLPYIITVGAVTDSWTAATRADDYVPDFSARGPTPEAHIKPDIVAPGGHMTGLTRPGSGLLKQHPEYQLPGGELVMTGTSQAAALVSGLAALLLQLEPDLSPDDVKCKLLGTAEPAINEDGLLAYSPFQQGHGYVSITRAITLGDRGCGNIDLNLVRDIAGEEHFEGPAIVSEDQQITLPGLDTMLSPLPPAKGVSDTRVWGVKAHVERLPPDHQVPVEHPFDWTQMYEFERTRIEKLAQQP
ncbi:S8 family peptidase [Seongchinamella sediminis]|uniref:S8 family peptidase n=1 Tax=Seongchinamella sediminis TaxID=2283635 RepID=UPI0013C31421|nr:S8 family peptidase [Seongchinamella sediminis]